MGSGFDDDTAVERAHGSTFTARVTDRWNTFLGPNGGYVLAIAARALAAELPMPDPLAISAHFLRPATPGEATIDVEMVKAGRRHATGLARMRQNGKDVLIATGTFGDLAGARGRELVLGAPPPLPPPDEAIDPVAAFDASALPSIGRRFDYRTDGLPGFARGELSGEPAYSSWIRFADGRAPDTLSLVAFPDALFPTVLEIGEVVSSTVEMSVYVRAVPAAGWLAMRAIARHIAGGYHEEDVEIWDSAGTLVAQSRQLALLGGS